MRYDIYLSYSGRRTYTVCPKQYNFRYVLKDPSVGDTRGSIFGSAIGKVFELFYVDKLWATEDPIRSCLKLVDGILDETLKKGQIDPNSDPGFRHMVRQDMLTYIPPGVENIRKLGFLTPYSKAEEDLTLVYSNEKYPITIKIGGRADFIHSADMRSVTIVDGKASKHREKYSDSEQLIWYAVQHYLKFQVAPNKLGFLYWAFPDDPIKWIAYDSKAMRDSLDQTFDVAKKILLKMFDPTPSSECRRCPYLNKCDDGVKYLAHKRIESGGGYINSSLFDLEPAPSKM